VPDYTYPVYNPSMNADEVHPYTEFVTMKYPKPGYPNPLVEVWVFDLDAYLKSGDDGEVSKFVRTVEWSGRRRKEDSVIMEVAWVANASLLVKEVNRAADDGAVVVVNLEAAREGAAVATANVVRRLGKNGEQGDEGWIDHVSFSFPFFWSRKVILFYFRSNVSTDSLNRCICPKARTWTLSPPKTGTTKSPCLTTGR
jgi:dipeptidyl aminopeptidase B